MFIHMIIFRETRVEPTKEVGTSKTIACAPSQYIDLELTDDNRISLGFTNVLLMGNTLGERCNIMKDVVGHKSTINIVKWKLNQLSQVKEFDCIVNSE